MHADLHSPSHHLPATHFQVPCLCWVASQPGLPCLLLSPQFESDQCSLLGKFPLVSEAGKGPLLHATFTFHQSQLLYDLLALYLLVHVSASPETICTFYWIMELEKTLESPLDCKEIKPVNPKGNQPWIFMGRTDAEAEAPIFEHLKQRADSLEKTLMLGKIEGRRRRASHPHHRGLEQTHWKRPWCWERLRAGGEGDNRGWDGWMASQTQWTWVGANPRR